MRRGKSGCVGGHDRSPDLRGKYWRSCAAWITIAIVAVPGIALHAQADSAHAAPRQSCRLFLCKPTLTIEGALNRSHIFGGPLVRNLETNVVSRVPSQSNFQVLLVVAVQTAIPRVGLFGTLTWLPNASVASNPFTEYTASETGGGIRGNVPAFAAGGSITALAPTDTHGWLSLTPYIDDLFSPAATPTAQSEYTHKLEVGATLTLGIVNWLPPETWLRQHLTGFITLDDVLTGEPSAGDQVPHGERVFLTNARPALVFFGLALQLVPLGPPR